MFEFLMGYPSPEELLYFQVQFRILVVMCVLVFCVCVVRVQCPTSRST